MIDCQDYLWNSCRRHGLDELCSRADDPGVLRVWSNHEPGNILHKQQRRLMTITGLNEIRDLLRRLGVNDPAKSWRLSTRYPHHATMIRNHSDLNTRNPSVAREHLFR